MKHFSIAVVILAIVQSAVSANSPSRITNPDDVTTVPSTTPHPTSIKLEQLKKMEESALKGWYDMVNNFLLIVKPDYNTLGIFIFL